MKNLLIGFILCSGIAHAANTIEIKDFNFAYTNPHGSGTAANFSRSKTLSGTVDVAVDKVGQDFKLSVSGAENHEFDFKNAPSFMIEADTMNVSGLNFGFGERLSLSMGSGSFNSPNDMIKLDGLSLNCDKDVSQAEAMDQVISGCMKSMALKSSRFSSQDATEVLSESLLSDLKASVGVNSLDFKSTGGKFTLGADIRASVSGRVKSGGNVSYDATTGIVTLEVYYVKFGILGVMGKVFDELKKKESDKLTVKQPFIYYKVK